jgi:4-hydroxy-L-threonine phosphate dehydrogenase PdxA
MDEFDIEEMRQRRNKIESDLRNQQKHAEEKKKTQEKVLALKTLFNEKTKVLELPFIRDADTDVKSAIRRAPSKAILDFIVMDLTKKFMTDRGMDYNDYLDYLDDLEEEAENNRIE